MPKVGKEQFDYTPEGIAEAEAYSEATGIPMSNAMERSQNYQMGGLVGGRLPAVGSAGLRQPQMGVSGYNKGGKVYKK